MQDLGGSKREGEGEHSDVIFLAELQRGLRDGASRIPIPYPSTDSPLRLIESC
jgi:hypothetical protein